jgi:hypothetical protein
MSVKVESFLFEIAKKDKLQEELGDLIKTIREQHHARGLKIKEYESRLEARDKLSRQLLVNKMHLYSKATKRLQKRIDNIRKRIVTIEKRKMSLRKKIDKN